MPYVNIFLHIEFIFNYSATWEEWQSWESCSTTCGQGNQLQRRTCKTNMTDSSIESVKCELYTGEKDINKKECITKPCGTWTSWTDFTDGSGASAFLIALKSDLELSARIKEKVTKRVKQYEYQTRTYDCGGVNCQNGTEIRRIDKTWCQFPENQWNTGDVNQEVSINGETFLYRRFPTGAVVSAKLQEAQKICWSNNGCLPKVWKSADKDNICNIGETWLDMDQNTYHSVTGESSNSTSITSSYVALDSSCALKSFKPTGPEIAQFFCLQFKSGLKNSLKTALVDFNLI